MQMQLIYAQFGVVYILFCFALISIRGENLLDFATAFVECCVSILFLFFFFFFRFSSFQGGDCRRLFFFACCCFSIRF